MIQTHQLQILAVLGQIPVRGDIQLSAICKLDLVHALLDSSDAMPRLLHRSAEESDQSSQARLHVGERFVVIQAEVIQILKQIEHYPARFLRVADRRLLCHYCNYAERVPTHCPKSQSEHIYFLGVGSEKVEEELHREFPKARIARLDRDTATAKRQYESILQGFREASYDILV